MILDTRNPTLPKFRILASSLADALERKVIDTDDDEVVGSCARNSDRQYTISSTSIARESLRRKSEAIGSTISQDFASAQFLTVNTGDGRTGITPTVDGCLQIEVVVKLIPEAA